MEDNLYIKISSYLEMILEYKSFMDIKENSHLNLVTIYIIEKDIKQHIVKHGIQKIVRDESKQIQHAISH